MAQVWVSRRRSIAAIGAASCATAYASAEEAQAATATPGKIWRDQKKFAMVKGRKMAYVEMGSGRPIVFLHGNPTSSYLWRNIMPHVGHLGRCIAPDLIGMGDSDKLPGSGDRTYSFRTHRDYLFGLFAHLGIEKDITLVLHDWGSGLGFDFAARHPDAIRGIAYMEAILRPPQQQMKTMDTGGGFFGVLRSPKGEEMVLQDNMFVERVLLGSLKYYLTPEDEAEYRRPYLEPGESRRPTLDWPRELPLDGNPKGNDDLIATYSQWLTTTVTIPKLFLHAVPGAIFSNKEQLEFARSLPYQKEVTVYGSHFVQEVSPDAIGRALADWLTGLA